MSSPTQAQTRKDVIDPALERVGWDLNNPNQVRFEIPVDDVSPAAWQSLQARLRQLRDPRLSYDTQLPSGVCDYALCRPDGDIITVDETNRTSIDPKLDQAQPHFQRLRLVAEALASPTLSGNGEGGARPSVAAKVTEASALRKLTTNWRTLVEAHRGAWV